MAVECVCLVCGYADGVMDADVDVDASAKDEFQRQLIRSSRKRWAALWAEEQVHLWTVVISQKSLLNLWLSKTE